MRWLSPYRYLTRLHDPPSAAERTRVEKYLAVLRVVMTLIAGAAYAVERPEPSRLESVVYVILSAYIVHGLVLYFWVRHRTVTRGLRVWAQVTDTLWPVLITAFSHGESSPFMPVFSYAVLTAGFRWGFVEAVLIAAFGAVIVAVEAALLHDTVWGAYEGNRALVRSAYFLALGYLVGTMGENEKERRAEADVVSRVLQRVRSGRSLRTVFEAVFSEYIGLFDASMCYLATHEISSGRVFLWRMPVRPQRALFPAAVELTEDDRFEYMLPGCPDAFYCRDAAHPCEDMLLLGDEDPREQGDVACSLQKLCPSGPVLSVSAPLANEWTLRLVVAGARLGSDAQGELSFARSLFQQSATALYGAYLLRRLRARASAVERARVARELHDGAIQSLLAAEMRTNILRRRAEKEWPAAAAEMASLEGLLHSEARAMRELMQQLRPVEVEPAQLLDHLAERVDRFRRDSGIAARFVSTEHDVQLTAHACRELLLIVQEALVNVRKHARANSVLVSFGRLDGQWRLTITDDGVGFGFEGTLAGSEFMNSPRGPAIIKERVANLGGELEVVSSSQGSQLLIRLPQKGHFTHG
ncbi:MAG: histidine kinase [Acidobacteriota bacterium]|nr:histidine kinase [Acidobacteriota bacterium]